MSKKDPKLYRAQDENVTIIGDTNISVPEELLLDTKQNFDDDARIWGYILKCARTGTEMPTQGEIAEAIGKSRPTVNLSIQMLRLNRWLTVIGDEREKGKFTKLTYALHGHQMPIEATLHYDPGFIDFVAQQKSSSKKRLMERALEVSIAVDKYLEKAKDESTSSEVTHSPCKNFLHGRHPSTTTSTSTSTSTTTNTNTNTTKGELSDFSINTLGTTGAKTEIGNSVTSDHKTEIGNSVTSDHKTEFGDSVTSDHKTEIGDPVTSGYKAEDEDGVFVTPGDKTEDQDKPDLHQYFQQVPTSVHKTLIKGFTKHELTPKDAEAVMRELVRRIHNPNLRKIDHLPKYIESLMKLAASGELYDAEAAALETKQRRAHQANEHLSKALIRRGEIHGIKPEENESEAGFKKRVEHAEYVHQMKHYGLDVDPITGAAKL